MDVCYTLVSDQPARIAGNGIAGTLWLEDVYIYMGVSQNNGTSKSSILIGFSILNHPVLGYPNFWKHPYISYCQIGDTLPKANMAHQKHPIVERRFPLSKHHPLGSSRPETLVFGSVSQSGTSFSGRSSQNSVQGYPKSRDFDFIISWFPTPLFLNCIFGLFFQFPPPKNKQFESPKIGNSFVDLFPLFPEGIFSGSMWVFWGVQYP